MLKLYKNYPNIFAALFSLSIFAFVAQRSTAQTNSSYSQVIPPSPTAVQFQRYGDYPVSNFTGVPDITIPIFTIKEGDITVPITLSYHASGCRPDDVSGFVGLGWSLNGDGMVSRTVNGIPDDGAYPFELPPQSASVIDFRGNTSMIQRFHDMERGQIDHEYDLYSYNFLGKSGKFVIVPSVNTNGIFPLLQKENLLFKSRNEIVDGNGITYSFGGDNNHAIEYKDYGSSVNMPITWHLTGITSASNPGIGVGFTYSDGPTYVYNTTDNYYQLDDYWIQRIDPTAQYYPYSPINDGGVISWGTQVRNFTTVLSQIVFSHGKIVFNKNPSTQMLASIDIYDQNNNLVKRVTLDIDTFPTAHTVSNLFSNFRLKSVNFKDVANNTIETYKFNYYWENEVDAKPQAFDFSAGRDYWGFYNGDDARATGLSWYPTLQTRDDYDGAHWKPIGFHSVNKDADEYHTKAYVLNKITYPTGGYSIFNFELNKNGINQNCGGLRIKTISSYLSNGSLATQKTYNYLIAHQEIIPTYEAYAHSDLGVLCSTGLPSRRFTISPTSSIDFSPQGSSVVYPNVEETDGRISTAYWYDYGDAFNYHDMDQGQMLQYPLPVPLPPSLIWHQYTDNYKPWNFGNLVRKTTSGATFYQDEQNEYEEFVSDTTHDFLMNRWVLQIIPVNDPGANCSSSDNFDQINASGGVSPWKYADHYYYSGGKRLKKSTTHYSPIGVPDLITEKNFYYDNPLKPYVANRITTANSKGETVRTDLKFPYDYTSAPYTDLTALNMVDPVIEQKETNITLGKELSKAVTNYDYFSGVTTTSGYTYANVKTVQKSIAGNTLQTQVTVDSYEANGKPRQITSRDGIVTTYLYGYNSLYPVAKIVGKTYAMVSPYISQATLDAPTDDALLRSYFNILRNNLPDAKISSYTYKPMVGITSETDPKRQTTTYEYDNFQRLKIIRDQDGKILKTYCYNYAGQVTGCDVPSSSFANEAQSGSLPKNDCSGGYTGSTVAYSIPAGTYFSSASVAQANALAMNAAQTYVNANGNCTVPSTVYARVEISNQATTTFAGTQLNKGDVYIRLYSNAICTIPYSPPTDLAVNVTQAIYYSSSYGSPNNSSSTNSYTISGGTSSLFLGRKTLESIGTFYSDYYGEYTETNDYTFDVTTGSGYITTTTLINY